MKAEVKEVAMTFSRARARTKLQKPKAPWAIDIDRIFYQGLVRLFFLAFGFIIMVYIITEALE